jgi:hypothetical protein
MAATRRFTLESLLQAVQEYRVTHLPIVPPIAAVLAKGSTKEKISNNGGGGTNLKIVGLPPRNQWGPLTR